MTDNIQYISFTLIESYCISTIAEQDDKKATTSAIFKRLLSVFTRSRFIFRLIPKLYCLPLGLKLNLPPVLVTDKKLFPLQSHQHNIY